MCDILCSLKNKSPRCQMHLSVLLTLGPSQNTDWAQWVGVGERGSFMNSSSFSFILLASVPQGKAISTAKKLKLGLSSPSRLPPPLAKVVAQTSLLGWGRGGAWIQLDSPGLGDKPIVLQSWSWTSQLDVVKAGNQRITSHQTWSQNEKEDPQFTEEETETGCKCQMRDLNPGLPNSSYLLLSKSLSQSG